MKRIVARRSGKPDRAAAGEGPCPLHAPLTNPLPPGSADSRGDLPVGVPACAQARGANARTLTITVTGARGGHGASTVAVAVALFAAGHAHTQLVTHDLLAAAALLGLGEPHGGVVPVTEHLSLTSDPDADRAARVRVHDAGIGDDAHEGTVLAVLRGPCYLGLRALVAHQGQRADGIVVLAESGRSLERRDVEDVTGVPVVAVVPVAPTVARAIDAGLLVARLHRLREFTALRRYVTELVAPAHHPTIAASQPWTNPVDTPDDVPRDTPGSAREPVSRIATDLPVALCATG